MVDVFPEVSNPQIPLFSYCDHSTQTHSLYLSIHFLLDYSIENHNPFLLSTSPPTWLVRETPGENSWAKAYLEKKKNPNGFISIHLYFLLSSILFWTQKSNMVGNLIILYAHTPSFFLLSFVHYVIFSFSFFWRPDLVTCEFTIQMY
jgi:hypothetical protein